MELTSDIDTHLIEAGALVMQPPAIVRYCINATMDFASLLKRAETALQESSAASKNWQSEANSIISGLVSVFERDQSHIATVDIDRLYLTIRTMEKQAENNAIAMSDVSRRMRKIVKYSRTENEGSVVGLEKTFKSLLDIWEGDIETILDISMILRGMAGKYDPDQEIVFTAESTQDIRDYFTSIGIS